MLLLKFIPAILGCCKRWLLFSGLGLVLFVCLFVRFSFRVLKTGLEKHY